MFRQSSSTESRHGTQPEPVSIEDAGARLSQSNLRQMCRHHACSCLSPRTSAWYRWTEFRWSRSINLLFAVSPSWRRRIPSAEPDTCDGAVLQVLRRPKQERLSRIEIDGRPLFGAVGQSADERTIPALIRCYPILAMLHVLQPPVFCSRRLQGLWLGVCRSCHSTGHNRHNLEPVWVTAKNRHRYTSKQHTQNPRSLSVRTRHGVLLLDSGKSGAD